MKSVPDAFEEDERLVVAGRLLTLVGAFVAVRAGIRGTLYSGVPSKVAYPEAARRPPRTPPFYRLDVRAEKRWTFASGSYLAVVAEVLNTTLNREVLTQSCNAYTCERTYTGPVTIPNLGLEGGF